MKDYQSLSHTKPFTGLASAQTQFARANGLIKCYIVAMT